MLIIDPTLVHQVDVFAGLDDDAYVLVNSSRSLHALQLEDLLKRCLTERVRTVAATELARAQGDLIVPRCPFVVAYLRRHPEFDDLRADRRP